jgi:hypothetical protein
MADIILHRRSFTTGSVPTTESLGVGQFAINVPDGKVFIHKSSSVSQSIVSVVTTDSITTGSITLTQTASAALFIGTFTGSFSGVSTNAESASYLNNLSQNVTITGSLFVSGGTFSGSGADLYDISASAIVGLNLARISTGSATASLSFDISGSSSLQINTDTAISGALYVSLYSGSTAITGTSIFGTASYSIYSDTASIALTASFVTYSATTLTNVKTVRAVGNILAGQVVRISGANGDNLLVTTASYFSDEYSANVLGVATANIADNATGTVVTDGEITGINLSAFAAGDLLYLGNLGNLTNVAPVAPLHAVRMGVVEKNTVNGIAYIRVDNGYELNELHDVTYVSRSIGDLLVVSNSVWYNTKQLTGSYGLTGSLTTTGSSIIIGSQTITGTHTLTGSFNLTGSLVASSSTIHMYQSTSVSGTNIFGTASHAATALTASYVQFQYNRELHVSVAGSDSTGDGTLLFPFRTISKALDSASSAVQIVVHPGTYAENPTVSGSASNVTITATNAEIGGIVEISGSLTVNQFSAATKVVGLAINNIIHSGSQNLYLQNVTVRSGVSKTGNGYLEATKIGCQSPANFSVTAPGTVVIQNSLVDGLVVNNASAVVNLLSNIAVTAPSCSLGILSIDGGVVYSQHVNSGSVFSGVGAIVSLANILCLTPTNTSASIKLNAASGISIKNVTYDTASSTLGVSLGNRSQFQQIQADGITGSFTGSFAGTVTSAQTASFANSGFTINSSSLYSFGRTSSFLGINSFSVPTGSSRGSILNYTVASASNARAGQVMSIWSGTTASYSETQTTDIGNTSGVSLTSSISGVNSLYTFGTSTAGWNIKFTVTQI